MEKQEEKVTLSVKTITKIINKVLSERYDTATEEAVQYAFILQALFKKIMLDFATEEIPEDLKKQFKNSDSYKATIKEATQHITIKKFNSFEEIEEYADTNTDLLHLQKRMIQEMQKRENMDVFTNALNA